MANKFLTVKQVSDRLKVHLMTIYKWISSGTLEAKRLPGGGLRIEAKELEKLLSENPAKTHTKRRRKADAKPRK